MLLLFADETGSGILAHIGLFISGGGLVAALAIVFRFFSRKKQVELTAEANRDTLLAQLEQREAEADTAEAKRRTAEAERERDAIREERRELLNRYDKIIKRQADDAERASDHLNDIQDRYAEKAAQCAALQALNQSLSDQLRVEQARKERPDG